MLTTIALILGIAWLALALWNSYVVPGLGTMRKSKEPATYGAFSGVVALVAIVLAILVGSGLVKLPPILR